MFVSFKAHHSPSGQTFDFVVVAHQEKAPLIQQKVFKIANDAYQHVDFSAVIDRALALSKDNILGAWPGQNPFGFNLDDRNFCLFAVPVLNKAPKEFNQMLKQVRISFCVASPRMLEE